MNKYLAPSSIVNNNNTSVQTHLHTSQQTPPQQLDGYEAEIVEDIPEQFDLSRYKKANKGADSGPFVGAYPRPPPLPPTFNHGFLYPQSYNDTYYSGMRFGDLGLGFDVW